MDETPSGFPEVNRVASSAKNKEPPSASGLVTGFDLRIFAFIPSSWHHSKGSVVDREVKLPAQTADDTVVRRTGSKVIQLILWEGDPIDACAGVPVLQVEPKRDVQLPFFVLDNS